MDGAMNEREQGDFEALERIARGRRSVRGFLSDPVPMSIQRRALELALSAPSNCNVQPWLVHVVSGKPLARIRHAFVEAVSAGIAAEPDFPGLLTYPGIYRDRQVDSARQLYAAMDIARDDRPGRNHAALRNFEFFDAPHAAFLFVPDWALSREIADCGLYAQTLMLGLTALGIASCPQGALGYYPDIVRSELGIGPDQRLLYGISFGFEDMSVAANAARTGRSPLEETTSFHG
ncbi:MULTISPECIES: nitroreductase [unclassified Sphingobium]|uniref:nitroreductase n=1 Tax=unclassified Sphingobium TaxID=2611147 RepID=UPI00343FBC9D